MKTLILSDIHANHAALKAVLDDAYCHFEPDEVWYLGDMAGYGPQPLSVWRDLRREPIPAGGWLAGNHDWGLVGKLVLSALFPYLDGVNGGSLKISHFRQEAEEVLRWHRLILQDNEELMGHLAGRPVMSRPRPGIYLAHGSFEDNARLAVTRYLRLPVQPVATLVDKFRQAATREPAAVHDLVAGDESPARLFAFGHTHVAGLWRWQAGRSEWQPLPLDQTYPLGDLTCQPLCLNPGSVGFPRDGSGCPGYVVIDWDDSQTLVFRRVHYNVEVTRRLMDEKPYSDLLQEVGFLLDSRC
ncbi:MAG: metallophosphoesterase family protein [Chloroflexota bacterium]